MYSSKSLALVGLALAASSAGSSAFTLLSPNAAASRSPSALRATRDPNNESPAPLESIRALAAASALAAGLLFPSAGALAAQDVLIPPSDHVLVQSSLTLSVEIKTMDFALPSSYDSIADPVAAGTEELTTTVNVNTSTGKTSAAKKSSSSASPSKKKEKEKEASDGLSAKEASEAARAAKKAQREAQEAEQAEKDAQAARERDERIKQARLEKIAAREAAKAEKEAADAEAKAEGKMKDVKFVDTSMPSY